MTGEQQNATADRPVVLFVVGFGRSGTSALTRLLSLCGAALPAALVGASKDNPLGHWEPRVALCLNETILRRHGSAGYDPTLRLHHEEAIDPAERSACIAKIENFYRTLPAAPIVVIKEQRITCLTEMWFEAAREAGYNVAAAIAVRHPQEVIGSMAARHGASPELSSALWLKYSLLAERETRDVPRVFVDFANLLDDWRREVKRISGALAIDLHTRNEHAIDEFLTPDLRHQRNHGPVTEPFGTDWISVVYETLSAAARDEPWNQSGLDRVFEAYRESEHGFRMALTEFYDHFNSVPFRLIRPSLGKFVLDVVAMARRRNQTWNNTGRELSRK